MDAYSDIFQFGRAVMIDVSMRDIWHQRTLNFVNVMSVHYMITTQDML